MLGSAPGDSELDLLLEEIYTRYHHDFRQYARSSLKRGVARAQAALGSPTLAQLLERIAQEPQTFAELLRYLTIQVSDLFRDPAYFRCLREKVVPYLATYPSLRVWVAGCGTGEEAYSLAILLHEEGLLQHSLIYATDIDPDSMRTAKTGSFELERARGFGDNYLRAGGRASLPSYYAVESSRLTFHQMLRERIVISEHSLATDAAFAEVQLVSCRNVLIYFEQALQERALGLFRSALCRRGFLGLGPKETLMFSSHLSAFEAVSADDRVFRLK